MGGGGLCSCVRLVCAPPFCSHELFLGHRDTLLGPMLQLRLDSPPIPAEEFLAHKRKVCSEVADCTADAFFSEWNHLLAHEEMGDHHHHHHHDHGDATPKISVTVHPADPEEEEESHNHDHDSHHHDHKDEDSGREVKSFKGTKCAVCITSLADVFSDIYTSRNLDGNVMEDLLDKVCARMPYRHRRPHWLVKQCEEMMGEHAEEIAPRLLEIIVEAHNTRTQPENLFVSCEPLSFFWFFIFCAHIRAFLFFFFCFVSGIGGHLRRDRGLV